MMCNSKNSQYAGKRWLGVIGGIIACLIVFPMILNATDGVVLDSDKTQLFPDIQVRHFTPGKTETDTASPGSSPTSPADLTRIPGTAVVWKVEDVRPISGNDPVNPVKPLLNYNGKDATTVEELIELIRTGEGGGGGNVSGCTGTVTMTPSHTSPPKYKFASFSLDPNTGNCIRNLMGGDSEGNIIFEVYPRYGHEDEFRFAISTWEAGWHFEGTDMSGFEMDFPASGTFVIYSDSGIRVQIVASASGSSAAPTLSVQIKKL